LIFLTVIKACRQEDALCAKQNGQWVKFSSDDYSEYSHWFSDGLLEIGFSKGDKIMTLTNNRPEWNFADMGMSMIGVIHVPVFASLSQAEILYIIEHSEAKAVIVSDKKPANTVLPAIAACHHPVLAFSFDNVEGVKSWKEIIETGRLNTGKYKENVETFKKTVSPDDIVTLMKCTDQVPVP
jgi:long-chain acyl-CoA synthetase